MDYLKKAGYAIVERNVRSRMGEIDIVARDGGCLVFVEVRTRRSGQMAPEESVGAIKQRRVADLGAQYVAAHKIADAEWRGDVVAIEQDALGKLLRLEHFINVIEEQ